MAEIQLLCGPVSKGDGACLHHRLAVKHKMKLTTGYMMYGG